MNITQINTAILQGNFTNDQLSSMIDAVKFARARLTEQTKRSLRIGDNVHFNSTKLRGAGVTGVVVKIAIKFENWLRCCDELQSLGKPSYYIILPSSAKAKPRRSGNILKTRPQR